MKVRNRWCGGRGAEEEEEVTEAKAEEGEEAVIGGYVARVFK